MVRHIGYQVSYHSIGYSDVPGPHLVQLVALLVGHRSLSQCRCKPGLCQGCVHFTELSVEVSAQDNLGGRVLPNDALS